jgi:hypothetical protein
MYKGSWHFTADFMTLKRIYGGDYEALNQISPTKQELATEAKHGI